MNTQRQLYYKNKGLNLTDAFIYEHIKKLPYPIKREQIKTSIPLFQGSTRQLAYIIKKLVLANLFVTRSSCYGLTFIFPFLTRASFCLDKTYSSCKNQHQSTLYQCRFLHRQPLYKYNNINKKTKYLKRNNVVVYKEDIFYKEDHSQKNI